MGRDRSLGFSGGVFIETDMICNGYFMRDPSVTLEDAQAAAIEAMRASRILDERLGTRFAQEIFARDRLVRLGVNPDSLEITRR